MEGSASPKRGLRRASPPHRWRVNSGEPHEKEQKFQESGQKATKKHIKFLFVWRSLASGSNQDIPAGVGLPAVCMANATLSKSTLRLCVP